MFCRKISLFLILIAMVLPASAKGYLHSSREAKYSASELQTIKNAADNGEYYPDNQTLIKKIKYRYKKSIKNSYSKKTGYLYKKEIYDLQKIEFSLCVVDKSIKELNSFDEYIQCMKTNILAGNWFILYDRNAYRKK